MWRTPTKFFLRIIFISLWSRARSNKIQKPNVGVHMLVQKVKNHDICTRIHFCTGRFGIASMNETSQSWMGTDQSYNMYSNVIGRSSLKLITTLVLTVPTIHFIRRWLYILNKFFFQWLSRILVPIELILSV